MRAYEGLFLVDDGRASDDFQTVADHIKGLLERHGASVEKLEKWDSRRLAYEVNGKKRGAYILTKFGGDPERIAGLERDCRISNIVLRAMFLRDENIGVTLEAAEEKVRAAKQKRAAEAAPESEAAPEPEAKPEAAPEAVAEPEPSPQEGAQEPAKPEPETEPKPEPEATLETPEQAPAAEAPAETAPAEEQPGEEAPAADEPSAAAPLADDAPAADAEPAPPDPNEPA